MEKNKKTFKVVTLGCRTNQYESFAYHNQLKAIGYEEVVEGEEADICIVNSCTVTASADSSSRHQIRQLARRHPQAKIYVTGCMVENRGEEVAAFEGVEAIIPNAKKEQLVSIVFPEEEVPEFSIKNFPDHTRAFVKVQDGCNSFCTYCVIPYVRGRSRSRTIPEIIREVEDLVASGYKEIVLTGINIGDFDGGKGKGEKKDSLADLVRIVDDIPGVERIRISSIDPDEVDDDLLDAVVNGKKTCHSMHLVLQSGSNLVLKRMNRKYTRQIFYDTYERLRAASPDFSLTTDVIVGFPGETERDFQETLEVVEEVKFAKVHMFPYSDRPRTRASQYEDKVDKHLIAERKQRLIRAAERAAFEMRQPYVGRKMTILTESTDQAHPGMIAGHTDNFLMVWLPDVGIEKNQLVEVELLENRPEGFFGSLHHVKRELLV